MKKLCENDLKLLQHQSCYFLVKLHNLNLERFSLIKHNLGNIFFWNIFLISFIILSRTLEGHLDTVSSACFTPDGALVITVCINGDFRVWSSGYYSCLFIKDDAHDLGIQYCDISENSEPIPNALIDAQTYLLATCGNDSLVKLWRITVPRVSCFHRQSLSN